MKTHIQRFFHHESAGGMVMLFAAALAMLLANSAALPTYAAIVLERFGTPYTFAAGIQGVLMPLFFLLVGMELKREMNKGFLATREQKILPLIAALGGIIVPAAIYLIVNRDAPLNHGGWAIPTATDIAFAVCIVSLLGKRVPPAAKIFLLAIAIYDDLAAICVIALFYAHGLAAGPALVSLVLIAAMGALRYFKVKQAWPTLVLGLLLWFFINSAGIHTTVAGMITGLLMPAAALDGFIKRLHPFVNFGILPLFAFVSAGVPLAGFQLEYLTYSLPLGILLGLCVGKPLGVLGATYLAVKFGLAPKPKGTSWEQLLGIAMLAGIGFTMSLFIGFLAFAHPGAQDPVKIGVLFGSLFSAIAGYGWLRYGVKKRA